MNNGEKPAFGTEFHIGLSKREYFAALAMQGLLSHYGAPKRGDNHFTNADELESFTTGCTMIADELLKQLETK